MYLKIYTEEENIVIGDIQKKAPITIELISTEAGWTWLDQRLEWDEKEHRFKDTTPVPPSRRKENVGD